MTEDEALAVADLTLAQAITHLKRLRARYRKRGMRPTANGIGAAIRELEWLRESSTKP